MPMWQQVSSDLHNPSKYSCQSTSSIRSQIYRSPSLFSSFLRIIPITSVSFINLFA